MNSRLREVCEQFIENKEILKSYFYMDNTRLSMAGSIQLLALGALAEENKIEECYDILKAENGVFSAFRGYVKVPMICRMTQEADPEGYFERVAGIYDQLSTGMFGSEYSILAAMVLADHVKPQDEDKYINRTFEIYDDMKDNHPFLTNSEDLSFAAALAVCGKPVKEMIADMEECYERASRTFHNSDARQALAQVLSMSDLPAEMKCADTAELWDMLKESGHKFGTQREIAILGELAVSGIPLMQIVDDIIDADEYLKRQEGFGDFLFGAQSRRTFAAVLALIAEQSIENGVLQAGIVSAIEVEIVISYAMMSATAVHTSIH